MATQTKRVAIIGAGASGLTAIKCCLDEGLEPVCFEKSDNIGGLWYYREDRDDQSCVYQSTVINTNKEVMCYSDFPIPAEFPIYMHNKKVLEYYHLYCDRFQLRQYIRFHTKVDSVVFADDYEKTGRWKVTTTPESSGQSVTEIYDAVMVCTGHHCTPHVPKFKGLADYGGRVLHSHDYLNPTGFEGKRVLIVGVGNSGCDAAVELARVASKVYLSTRRGMWVIHRVSHRGMPRDLRKRITGLLPHAWAEWRFKQSLEERVDHTFLGIKPKHSPLAQHPTVNDYLPNCIMNGSIIVKTNVSRFNKSSVVFDDGTEEDIDIAFLATGYVFRFPFLEDSVVKVTNNQLPLYKYVFPPDLQHPTIAFIGYIQPRGAINPISEMQARWATRVFKGLVSLPSNHAMKENIREKRDAMSRRYVNTQRHTIQVDFAAYMDDVALEFGVRPDFRKMALHDPVLAWKCVFGPFNPVQYRLVGPGTWDGARPTIMTLWDRLKKPLQTRVVEDTGKDFSLSSIFAFLVVVVAVLYLFCF